MGKLISKSYFAGISIGMAGIISSYAIPAIAPFVFAIGLLIVILGDLNLYTGKIGTYPIEEKGLLDISLILIFNIVGAWAAAQYFKLYPITDSLQIALQYKNNQSFIQVFFSSIFCGILMYTAVTLSQKSKSREIIVILAVSAFIIAKFNHSIADSFYLSIDGINLHDIAFLFYAALGNAFGAKLLHYISNLKIEEHT